MSSKEPCPNCQKNGKDTNGDNLVAHPDHGYKKCFACGYFESVNGLLRGDSIEIADRGLSKQTCEKYGIQILSYTGKFYKNKSPTSVENERCVLFDYYDNGKIKKQKMRSLVNKPYMKLVGNTKFKGLFGKQLFNPTKKLPIVITEGEFDAASVWQATELPAVSLPNGAQDIKSLLPYLDWLQEWKFIALCFDNDESGKQALDKAIDILPVGSARIVHIPYKDANDMVMDGKDLELKKAIWNAEIYRPESIVTVNDIIDHVLEKPQYGLTLPWDFLYQGMYGLQPNHLYSVIGFSKVGKTEFMKEIIFHLLENENIPIGIFSLEQGAASTIQRMIASKVNKPLHLPSNDWWDSDKLKTHANDFNEKIYLYDNSSNEHLTLENLLINIRYMYYCFGIKVVILDNLSAMCSYPVIDGKHVSDELFTAHIMKKLFTLTRELPLSILLVAHIYESKLNRQIHIPTSVENKANYLAISENEMNELINKPGLDWASGRMPGLADINKMVGRMSDYVLGLARNLVSDNEVIRRTLKVKFLATRLGSEYCGKEMRLIYDYETGRYTDAEF